MPGRGPPPKPAHLRQRTNKKAGATTLTSSPDSAVPELPNPDGRVWHPLTVQEWAHAWTSPMASQWLETDLDALSRLAILWDEFHKGDWKLSVEIRLQSALFGLSPLDRSRLQWQVAQGAEAEEKLARRVETTRKRTGTHDPRRLLQAVK